MANLVTQHNASVAQLAEHALRKRMVMGSIPIRGLQLLCGVLAVRRAPPSRGIVRTPKLAAASLLWDSNPRPPAY